MAKRVVCVFDLDHTLIRVNSSYHFGCYLYRKGIISLSKALSLAFFYFRHKFLGMATGRLHEEVFCRLFKGKKLSFFQNLVNDYLDIYLDDIVYVPGYRRLIEAQRFGYNTMIVSSSPGFIVEAIAYRFTVDSWRATQYSRDGSGLFNKVAHIVDGEDKAKYVKEVLEEKYDEIWGFSDSILDKPFLESVTNPVAVNPDGKLWRYSKMKDWEVVE